MTHGNRTSLPQFGDRQPNLLVIMVDEMRYPPIYESPQLGAFRTRYLRTQDELRSHGVEFHRHYPASTACAPSRTSLFTGQYPSLHGVTQTTGAAKGSVEPDTYWLDPSTVPTMGDYFRAAGYRTHYRGKWHVSDADMPIPGTHAPWPTYETNGNPIPTLEALYQEAGRLEGYGFEGWIGPEPHGSAPLNSGSSAGGGAQGRDLGYAQQGKRLIEEIDGDEPWLIVQSFVNPHDIVLYGLLGALATDDEGEPMFDFAVEDVVPAFDELFNGALFTQSAHDDLSQKPSVQASYKSSYWQWLQPIPPGPMQDHQQLFKDYFRFYYQLHKNVDEDMMTVYQALKDSAFYEDTVVIFTSDHGDLLGSHNYLHQKWYQVYDEALRVPLIISNPRLFPEHQNRTSVTSHVDLIPTMLGLAGVSEEDVRKIVSTSHSDAEPLVGRDLTTYLLGDEPSRGEPIFFMTDDDPARGLNMESWYGIEHQNVAQPSHIECVIVECDGQVWKFARYFDNPQFWSSPGNPGDLTAVVLPNGESIETVTVEDVVSRQPLPTPRQPGAYVRPIDITVKQEPVPDEYEMYNISVDPMELNNLYGRPEYGPIQHDLELILEQQRAEKRLVPKSGLVPGQPVTRPPGKTVNRPAVPPAFAAHAARPLTDEVD